MFKSCCARPNKKNNKSKSKADIMEPSKEKNQDSTNGLNNENKSIVCEKKLNNDGVEKQSQNLSQTPDDPEKTKSEPVTLQSVENLEVPLPKAEFSHTCTEEKENSINQQETDSKPNNPHADDSTSDTGEIDIVDQIRNKRILTKKRFSVDFKRNRLDFKRYSVDVRRDSATLEELARLEEQLARTNVDVRPGGRRKSTGILKSTTSSVDVSEHKSVKLEGASDDDEVFEVSTPSADDALKESPATPVGRDELALRRHRFFSDLVCAARAAVEHRVRFDPLGPVVAGSGSEETPAVLVCPAAELEALIERLEQVTSRLEQLPALCFEEPQEPPPTPQEPIITDNMSVNGYQDLMLGPLKTYLQLSQHIGGDVAAHAALVNNAFQAQFKYIQLATSRGKPSQGEEQQLLAPTSEQISAIQQFREKKRASPLFNHLSAISESIPALGWVAVAPTPGPYVKEMNDAGQFYTNRVLKEWKEKDKRHAEWCRAWVQLLTDLQAYVKQYHTTGLVWSGKGGAPAPPPGGMPPPPPLLPEVDFSNLSVDDRSALFAEINRGEAITNNLRKVTSEMQTHKNPGLRQGPAPFKAAPAARGPAKPLPTPGAGALDKPPVFARDGKKWLIEYQKGNSNLVVENAEMNNVVYMFRCRDSALTVRGKINGVVLDSCTKCAVVFDHLVASVEFVNCQSVQMQVLGKVPTISVDKTDGCQIYLSPQSLDVEIVSSKSSEMNVLVPKGNGDYTEHPVPEQFKTVITKSGLSTTPVESTG